jgi:hypothetical protein
MTEFLDKFYSSFSLEQLSAMVFVISAWLVLCFIFSFLGLLIRRSCGLRIQSMENIFISFWIGWAFTIVILQVWHLCFPVDWRVFVFISILSLIGLLLNWRDIWHLIRQGFSRNWIFCFIVLPVAVFLANHAIDLPNNGDSGLYHLNSIRWAVSYPIVPGLGNLHGRLAFNSSYFLYVAMLEIGFWAHRSYHLANSLLMFVLFSQVLFDGFRLIKGRAKLQGVTLFNVILLLSIIPVSAIGINISSPSPDLPIFILGIMISSQLLAFLLNSRYTCKDARFVVFSVTMLATVGITVKLSFIAFGATTLLVTFIVCFVKYRRDWFDYRRILLWIIPCAAITLLPWMLTPVYSFLFLWNGVYLVRWLLMKQTGSGVGHVNPECIGISFWEVGVGLNRGFLELY